MHLDVQATQSYPSCLGAPDVISPGILLQGAELAEKSADNATDVCHLQLQVGMEDAQALLAAMARPNCRHALCVADDGVGCLHSKAHGKSHLLTSGCMAEW